MLALPNFLQPRTMSTLIGRIESIYRYPVKSMRGESVDGAGVGWYGLEGDRRLAFRRVGDVSGFPWLTAGKLAELLLFEPQRDEGQAEGALPSRVRTPDGNTLPVFSAELAADIERRYGSPVQMMQLAQGMFDAATISVIASDTVREIERLAGCATDVRQFRPNVVVRMLNPIAFDEDEWVGGSLVFGDGDGDGAPTVSVTMRDPRCSMIGLNVDTARATPDVLKAVVRANNRNAGVYGTVTRTGHIAVGQRVVLQK